MIKVLRWVSDALGAIAIVFAVVSIPFAACATLRPLAPVADAVCESQLLRSPAFAELAQDQGKMLIPYADEACTILEVVEAVDAAASERAADPGEAAVAVLRGRK